MQQPERASIVEAAEELGWSSCAGLPSPGHGYQATAFTLHDRCLTVWWSDNGFATAAELTTARADGEPGTQMLAHREWFGEHGTVGDWVRDALRTWRIEYRAEAGA